MMSCLAVNVTAADTEWSKGDSWEYAWTGSEEGMTFSGSVKMEVTKTVSVVVGGHTESAFVVGVSGEGTISGTFLTTTASGSIVITGSDTRLQSDFSLVSSSVIMTMSIQATGLTMSMAMGMDMTSDPPVMDLPFNETLTLGATFHSQGTQTGTAWTNFVGTNETTPVSEGFNSTIVVASTGVSVTVEAGTFDCVQLDDMVGGVAEESSYFSPKVGNIVKSTVNTGGTSFNPTMLGDLELTAYSHGSGGSTMMIWIIVIVVAIAAVAAVAVLLAMKARGGPPVGMMPQQAPPQGMYGPPPPQPPVQPGQ